MSFPAVQLEMFERPALKCSNCPPRPRFGGATFDEEQDGERLRGQLERVRRAMSDLKWWTLGRLSEETGDPEGSVSARIRQMKALFRQGDPGGREIDRRRVVPGKGLREYRIKVS